MNSYRADTFCCDDARTAPELAATPTASARRPLARLARFFDRLLAAQARAAERRQLMQLDDRMLSDIGLSRADVVREAEKPFWRP